MLEDSHLSAPQPGDATGIGAVLLLGLVLALGIGLGRITMARPGRGRENKMRDRAAKPEAIYPQIARAAIRDVHEADFDDVKPKERTEILTAVLDAETNGYAGVPAGVDAMRAAAVDVYRAQRLQERYVRQSEGDDE